jgi:hypothetical protein
MRLLLFLALLTAGVFASPAYSAALASIVPRVGGTADLSVSSPTATGTAVEARPAAFDPLAPHGRVTHYKVTWTPGATGAYRVDLVLVNATGAVVGSGTITVTATTTALRTDTLAISPPPPIAGIAEVHVAIVRQ